LDFFGPIKAGVQIKQKTVKHAPIDKLIDAFISLLAGAHGLVEINSRLRTDIGLQRAFGRVACAEQAGQYHRRGRQLGRVLATHYQEVVVDQLFAGNVQLIKALQPLVEAAETTLQLDEIKRKRTIIRLDAGAGTVDDLNWLLARGYEVIAKEYSGSRIRRLAGTVTEWVQDPNWTGAAGSLTDCH
jgi:hypothetical protein